MAQAKKSAPKFTPKFTPKIAASAAKVTDIATNKATKAAFSAVESSRNSAEQIVKMGSDSTREWIASGTEEFQKAQEKLFAIGREAAGNLSRTAESASETLSEAIEQAKENVEALLEVSNLTIDMCKDISAEAVNFANEVFADNVETSKELFSCRTVNDLIEIQSRALKTNLDSLMNQTMRMSEMFFEYASETAEPLNERAAEAADRFVKALTKVA